MRGAVSAINLCRLQTVQRPHPQGLNIVIALGYKRDLVTLRGNDGDSGIVANAVKAQPGRWQDLSADHIGCVALRKKQRDSPNHDHASDCRCCRPPPGLSALCFADGLSLCAEV